MRRCPILRVSRVLTAPQRLQELPHGHELESVDAPGAGPETHADVTLELPLLGEGAQNEKNA